MFAPTFWDIDGFEGCSYLLENIPEHFISLELLYFSVEELFGETK